MTNTSLYPRFSDAEYSRRYAATRVAMREAILVFPGEGEPTLFVQMFNHVPNARQVTCIADVRWGGPDTAVAAAGNLAAIVECAYLGLGGKTHIHYMAATPRYPMRFVQCGR